MNRDLDKGNNNRVEISVNIINLLLNNCRKVSSWIVLVQNYFEMIKRLLQTENVKFETLGTELFQKHINIHYDVGNTLYKEYNIIAKKFIEFMGSENETIKRLNGFNGITVICTNLLLKNYSRNENKWNIQLFRKILDFLLDELIIQLKRKDNYLNDNPENNKELESTELIVNFESLIIAYIRELILRCTTIENLMIISKSIFTYLSLNSLWNSHNKFITNFLLTIMDESTEENIDVFLHCLIFHIKNVQNSSSTFELVGISKFLATFVTYTGNLGGTLNGLLGGGQQQQQQQPPQQQQNGNNQNIGGQVEGLLNQFGLGNQLTHQIGGLINGVASNFFAPNPNSPIPPHVQRRIMRYCSKHPNDPKCQNHPEWILPQGSIPEAPQVGNSLDLNSIFPNIINFHLPPIPQLPLQNLLNGVPNILKQVVPLVGQLTAIARQSLLNICSQRGDCLKQKPESLNMRASLAEQEAAVFRTHHPGRPQEQLDNEVELRLARTFQVKKALIRKAGLEGKIEPANNGVYQEDILLTEQQANALINQINQNSVGVGVVPQQGRFKRAGNSLYLESVPNQQWPLGQPIQYMFDVSVTSEADKNAVRQAINEIQSKIQCLSFQEVGSKPAGSHLYYVKYALPGFCGQSYVGRLDVVNPIYLSFSCGNAAGVALHETLHALGLQHEQLRIDRDRFITINWQNVNPQHYDAFAVSDAAKFTSYGIRYDYGSIMHYASTIATQNFGQKTMTAKINPQTNDPLMGQRNGLSETDVAELKRMYCMPEKETMDVWVNGSKVETTGEFVDEGGTKTHFEIDNKATAYILSQSSGKRQIGLVHQLYDLENCFNRLFPIKGRKNSKLLELLIIDKSEALAERLFDNLSSKESNTDFDTLYDIILASPKFELQKIIKFYSKKKLEHLTAVSEKNNLSNISKLEEHLHYKKQLENDKEKNEVWKILIERVNSVNKGVFSEDIEIEKNELPNSEKLFEIKEMPNSLSFGSNHPFSSSSTFSIGESSTSTTKGWPLNNAEMVFILMFILIFIKLKAIMREYFSHDDSMQLYSDNDSLSSNELNEGNNSDESELLELDLHPHQQNYPPEAEVINIDENTSPPYSPNSSSEESNKFVKHKNLKNETKQKKGENKIVVGLEDKTKVVEKSIDIGTLDKKQNEMTNKNTIKDILMNKSSEDIVTKTKTKILTSSATFPNFIPKTTSKKVTPINNSLHLF
ncbi:ZnMc domain-containing protein [Meloidogyne graminicola]|uniref:Metalloendopeptidase n=1 Tax=Meloidogyne graminicola TaxID=189291 RepID=A0A8S9ZQY7_9BILA|nr:ZnMc domain-containing protein [Meloidogyne graminicola]